MKKYKPGKVKRSVSLITAEYGMMIAAALILSYLESQIPAFFAVPGMKLGLTNVVVLTALYMMDSKSAMAINVVRIVLISFLFGGFSAMIYSLAGGMLSTAVMILLKKTGCFSIVPVSIAGGVSHNIGQIIVAVIVLNTSGIAWTLAALWISGLVSGALIGLLAGQLVKRLPGVSKMFNKKL